jgi:uncharacterized membrane protein YoaK (UPF0700 family)
VRDSAVATDQDTASDPVSILAALLALTVVSGLVDAVSYLGLGHVFTANMTGNVVVLGFAAAGTPGFSVSATLTSLGVFLVGAALPLLIAAVATAGTAVAFWAGPAARGPAVRGSVT